MRHRLLVIIIVFFLINGCQEKKKYEHSLMDSAALVEANSKLTEVMVHDIFSPPVASRIYSYCSIAAYEVAALASPDYQSLTGQLKGFEKKEFDTTKECHFPLAALVAYYTVAKALVFSEDQILQRKEELYESVLSQGIPDSIFKNSIDLGEAVAKHVLQYAAKDNYHQSRSFEKYTIKSDLGTWKPTPPAYMEGIEPHWNKIRPMILDSADQFIPVPPTAFDTLSESDFFQEAKEVMDAGNTLTDEQSEIAYFWDCNPYKMNIKGHVMFAEKKITPGGHWMGIATIAAKTLDLDWKETSEAMVYASIALFDAFIACWDEKYRSILIRPETYINQYMDENWVPLLQTPPFPEYTSGHSVASTAASIALTHVLGDNVHFVDSTEVLYGLPVREFDSFKQAAAEAAISRFYGGIHYMPAIENGIDQGRLVGNHVISKINTKSKTVANAN